MPLVLLGYLDQGINPPLEVVLFLGELVRPLLEITLYSLLRPQHLQVLYLVHHSNSNNNHQVLYLVVVDLVLVLVQIPNQALYLVSNLHRAILMGGFCNLEVQMLQYLDHPLPQLLEPLILEARAFLDQAMYLHFKVHQQQRLHHLAHN